MLVIFDLDGTLLNTLDDLAAAGNYVLANHGFPIHPVEAYKQFVGNGIRKLIERAVPQKVLENIDLESLFQEFMAYYSAHKMDKTMPYNGIIKLLEWLQNKGIKLAVASNKAHEAMEPLMQHYFPTIRFDVVLGHKPGANPKPSPDMVLEIMKKTRETNETTLYVGDSNVDMLTAANARLTKIGVLWGFRSRDELVDAGADYLLQQPNISDFEDIMCQFGNLSL